MRLRHAVALVLLCSCGQGVADPAEPPEDVVEPSLAAVAALRDGDAVAVPAELLAAEADEPVAMLLDLSPTVVLLNFDGVKITHAMASDAAIDTSFFSCL